MLVISAGKDRLSGVRLMSILPPSCMAATLDNKGLIRSRPYLQGRVTPMQLTHITGELQLQRRVVWHDVDVITAAFLYGCHVEQKGNDAL